MNKPIHIERIEAQALRRQQIAFCLLTAFLLAPLLLLHSHFSFLLGEPSESVLLILAFVFLAKMLECAWLMGQRDGISERSARVATIVSIAAVFVLTAVLVVLTDRDEVPYFVLLAIPILQCAYRFSLPATLLTIAGSVGLMFTWSQHFFALHPPALPAEFLETGMISVIYFLMGTLVWFLVHQLEIKQARLYRNMIELEAAREKLLNEERLAAVGRLASGVAHEIRNPVAMIVSSLSTAADQTTDAAERQDMFDIAAREAKRLENLTNDFLHYARPSVPHRSQFPVNEIVNHVVNMIRVRAVERSIDVCSKLSVEVTGNIDASQIEGALLNVGMNAIDATPDAGRITFSSRCDDLMVAIDVENSGNAISEQDMVRIFEPFFTTKPGGTGLGLAIARTAARAHGGDLWVGQNRDGAVVFTMTFRLREDEEEIEEAVYGKSADR
jgi:signal transduction histidine kinase